MALTFPEFSHRDPASGLLVIDGQFWGPITGITQADLNTAVNGVLTGTPYEIRLPDPASGMIRVITSADGYTYKTTLEPRDPPILTEDQFDPEDGIEPEDGIVSDDDPAAAAADEAAEDEDPFNENDEDDDDGEETAEELAERRAGDAAAAQVVANAENDWRVRLHLGSSANYLYKSDNPGILKPLQDTDGIIFPYTPTIAVQYNADYENYDLVHSNYRGYFYKGSQVQNILLTATFTANDVEEANYLLASLHFLRSCTKMFYGKDTALRGMPPPIVFLTGLGEFQFNNHPCAITMMNYNLPNDVDYIPCGKPHNVPQTAAPKGTPSTQSARAKSVGLQPGTGKQIPNANPNQSDKTGDSIYNKATYVPTKIDINFTMIPIQTRDQVSKEFSLEEYANGDLLKKGFW